MVVSSGAKPVVVLFEIRLTENGYAGPMVKSVAKGQRASSPHKDFGIFLATFSTFLSDGSDATQTPEGLEISESNRIVCVAEHGSKHVGTDAGERSEDGGISVGLVV